MLCNIQFLLLSAPSLLYIFWAGLVASSTAAVSVNVGHKTSRPLQHRPVDQASSRAEVVVDSAGQMRSWVRGEIQPTAVDADSVLDNGREAASYGIVESAEVEEGSGGKTWGSQRSMSNSTATQSASTKNYYRLLLNVPVSLGINRMDVYTLFGMSCGSTVVLGTLAMICVTSKRSDEIGEYGYNRFGQSYGNWHMKGHWPADKGQMKGHWQDGKGIEAKTKAKGKASKGDHLQKPSGQNSEGGGLRVLNNPAMHPDFGESSTDHAGDYFEDDGEDAQHEPGYYYGWEPVHEPK